ncbi:MAG: hypothetical protein NTX86_03600, partial [Candidatus Dependentiae bacterium]|nr:hypothetical protein [Candidatus Dependentiae bacterium]
EAQKVFDKAITASDMAAALTQAQATLQRVQDAQKLTMTTNDDMKKTASDALMRATVLVQNAQSKLDQLKNDEQKISQEATTAAQTAITQAQTAQAAAKKVLDAATTQDALTAALEQAQTALNKAQDAQNAAYKTNDAALHNTLIAQAQNIVGDASYTQAQALLKLRQLIGDQTAITQTQKNVDTARTAVDAAHTLEQLEPALEKAFQAFRSAEINQDYYAASTVNDTLKAAAQRALADATPLVKIAQDKYTALVAIQSSMAKNQQTRDAVSAGITQDDNRSALKKAESALIEAKNAKALVDAIQDDTIKASAQNLMSYAAETVSMAQEKIYFFMKQAMDRAYSYLNIASERLAASTTPQYIMEQVYPMGQAVYTEIINAKDLGELLGGDATQAYQALINTMKELQQKTDATYIALKTAQDQAIMAHNASTGEGLYPDAPLGDLVDTPFIPNVSTLFDMRVFFGDKPLPFQRKDKHI